MSCKIQRVDAPQREFRQRQKQCQLQIVAAIRFQILPDQKRLEITQSRLIQRTKILNNPEIGPINRSDLHGLPPALIP